MVKAGYYPDVISSDIHAMCQELVVDLSTTMSKLPAVDMSLDQVVEATTWTPAQVLQLQDDLGTLKEGTTADIAILELERGNFSLRGGFGNTVESDQLLRPVGTILNGEIIGTTLTGESSSKRA